MATRLKSSNRESRHLAKSVLLEETGSPVIIRLVILFSSLVVVAFLIWAAKTQVEEIAIAMGEIVPTNRVRKVQHEAGGVISEILVKNGDLVRDGEELIRLRSVLSKSQLEQAQARQASLLAQKERLRAFIEGVEPYFSETTKRNAEFTKDQKRIFEHLISYRNTRRAVLTSQLLQLEIELEELEEENKIQLEQKSILEAEIALQKDLIARKLAPTNTAIEFQRDLSDVRGELALIPKKKARSLEKINEFKTRLEELNLDITDQSLKELAKVDEELTQLTEIIKQNNESVQRSRIYAPIRGFVHGLAISAVGEVIAPGATILEIVPEDKNLTAEVKISARDIGHIKLEQLVTLKFTTYDFTRYGGLTATLNEISPTTFIDTDGQPYYRGTVSLTKTYIGKDPKLNPVLPGMTLQADIKTGSKTILEYLLKPVFSSVQVALKER
ncbi:MAG: HlyD family type I secretion periplasmic adaptor subunit [SAR324 cluster bacterium]|nr:HlyD family type I secretion periplasmic adaptor subunit [SAR324 cluster bacterium]